MATATAGPVFARESCPLSTVNAESPGAATLAQGKRSSLVQCRQEWAEPVCVRARARVSVRIGHRRGAGRVNGEGRYITPTEGRGGGG